MVYGRQLAQITNYLQSENASLPWNVGKGAKI